MIIDGIYVSTKYRNEQTGYTKFGFKYFGEAKDWYVISVVAYIPVYTKDMPLEIEGEFTSKNIFQASRVIEKINDNDISVAYLSNKNFCGIGPKKAKAIVDTLGPDIFSLVESDDVLEKLTSVKGITNTIASDLIFKIRNTILQRKLFELFFKYKGSVLPAAKLIARYKNNALKVLEDNPYLVCTQFDVSFYTADAIAKDLNFSYIDKKRIEALSYEALKMASNQGHCFLFQEEFYKNIQYVIKNSMFHDNIPFTYILAILIKCNWLKIEAEDGVLRFFLKHLYFSECEVVRHINRINKTKINLKFNENIIDEIEKKYDIKYHKLQKQSFDILKDSGIKILTGGPGTGKTTVLNGLVEAFKILNPGKSVALCSPTGRAAQRIKEQTSLEAFTVHKLLDIKPFDNIAEIRNSINTINADFVIVDEFSMIDIEVMSLLLNAIQNKTLVLFVGDVDQLPSVGPGNVMRDLIKSSSVPTFKLSNIYRQTSGSLIIDNANKVISEHKNILENKDSFSIIRLSSKETFDEKIKEIYENNKDFNVSNTQVLSTVKKDDGGVNNLNKILQKIFIPETTENFTNFRIHDKIIINKNDYNLGVFNGDLGFIKSITNIGIYLDINGEDFFIPNTEIDILSLAYAITVHKSQGSEFENVILVLPDKPDIMLQRNLLYTAITRAKKKIIILTKRNSFFRAIEKNDTIIRNTTLEQRLKETQNAF